MQTVFEQRIYEDVGEAARSVSAVTLRDRFAMAALPGIMAAYDPRNMSGDDITDAAVAAYGMADAMIGARRRQ